MGTSTISALQSAMASNAAELQAFIVRQGDDFIREITKQERELAGLVANRQNSISCGTAYPNSRCRPHPLRTFDTPATSLTWPTCLLVSVTIRQLSSAFDTSESFHDVISQAATASRRCFPNTSITLADAFRFPPVPLILECVPTLLRLVSIMRAFHVEESHTWRSPDG